MSAGVLLACSDRPEKCACPQTRTKTMPCTPIQIDTVLIVDPEDLSKEWFATSFYTITDDFDSLVVSRWDQTTVRCGWRDNRLILMNIRTRIAAPDE